MDETLTRVAVDVSGRPYLVWKVAFSQPKLGEMDTELFRELFQAFAQNAGITLHVETLYGENNHHIAETCFKGLARALRAGHRHRPPPGRPRALHQGHAVGRNRRQPYCAECNSVRRNTLSLLRPTHSTLPPHAERPLHHPARPRRHRRRPGALRPQAPHALR